MIDLTSPNTIAFLQFVGLGFLGVVAAFGQWFGRRKESAPPASQDLMIPSVSIADRVTLERLTETLRDAERIAREHREHDWEMLLEMREMNKSNGRIEGLIQRLIDKL